MQTRLLLLLVAGLSSGSALAESGPCRVAGEHIICNEEASRAMRDAVCPVEWMKDMEAFMKRPYSQPIVDGCQMVCKNPASYGKLHAEVGCSLVNIIYLFSEGRPPPANGNETRRSFEDKKWFCENQPEEYSIIIEESKSLGITLGEHCFDVASNTEMGLGEAEHLKYAKKSCIAGNAKGCALAKATNSGVAPSVGCTSDTLCKAGRVCRNGRCTAP